MWCCFFFIFKVARCVRGPTSFFFLRKARRATSARMINTTQSYVVWMFIKRKHLSIHNKAHCVAHSLTLGVDSETRCYGMSVFSRASSFLIVKIFLVIKGARPRALFFLRSDDLMRSTFPAFLFYFLSSVGSRQTGMNVCFCCVFMEPLVAAQGPRFPVR